MNKFVLTGLFAIIFSFNLHAQTIIKMQENGGVYTMPCEVNGLKLRFIFDTGASDVSISITEAIFMLKNGYLSKEDVIGKVQYSIANGDIEEGTTINLKKIIIGNKTLQNVAASVVNSLNAPLLLGQSAIQKLGEIQINGNQLIIMDSNQSSVNVDCVEANNLINEAYQQYKNSFYDLSIETYQKALLLCPDAFSCNNLFDLGNVFFLNNSFENAEKYFEDAIACGIKDTVMLDLTYYFLGISQYHISDYNKSKTNLQKSLFFSSKLEIDADCYLYLGKAESQQKNYSYAIEYFKKSIDLILKIHEIDTKDIINGRCDNSTLASAFSSMAVAYVFQENYDMAEMYMTFAAQCGDEASQSYFNKKGIDYRKRLKNNN